MSEKYYQRFKIVLDTKFSRSYHRWTYKKACEDSKKLDHKLDFSKKSFTCLLSGVGNEATADEMIRFVSSKNSRAKIIIIDKGEEQIEAVKSLVKRRYPNMKIIIRKIDALDLTSFIANGSVDWIETDGFLEYFDKKNLELLLEQWHKILTKDGIITFRDAFNQSFIDSIFDFLRIKIARAWLCVTVYKHKKKWFDELLTKTGFRYLSKNTCLPTFIRYALVKENSE